MKILAFDTSGLTATVALADDKRLIGEYSTNHKKTHSQTLMVMMDELLKSTDTDISTIDAIALSSGPGSFTGLRIGSASAKGLAFALNKPIVSVPTMEAMAYNMFGTQCLICPMMDARRKQAFTGIYRFEGAKLVTVMPQGAMALEELIAKLNSLDEKVILLGDGTIAFEEEIKANLKCEYVVAPVSHLEQRAASVAALAFEYVKENRIEDAHSHVPHYYRLSQAEREKLEKELVLKPIEDDDIDALCQIEAATFSMPWTKQSFMDLKNSDNNYYIVAHLNGEVIGCAGVWNGAGDGNITNVVIRADHRRKGYGERMLEKLMADGKAIGIENYTLEVRKSNDAAIRMYEKLGFVSEGIRPGFYEKPVEDAVIMWKR